MNTVLRWMAGAVAAVLVTSAKAQDFPLSVEDFGPVIDLGSGTPINPELGPAFDPRSGLGFDPGTAANPFGAEFQTRIDWSRRAAFCRFAPDANGVLVSTCEAGQPDFTIYSLPDYMNPIPTSTTPCAFGIDGTGRLVSDCYAMRPEFVGPDFGSTTSLGVTAPIVWESQAAPEPVPADAIGITNNQATPLSFGIMHGGLLQTYDLAVGERRTLTFSDLLPLVGHVKAGGQITTVTLERGKAYEFMVVGAVYYLVADL